MGKYFLLDRKYLNHFSKFPHKLNMINVALNLFGFQRIMLLSIESQLSCFKGHWWFAHINPSKYNLKIFPL